MAFLVLMLVVVMFPHIAVMNSIDPTQCGDNWCLCFHHNLTALCRGHRHNLTYIPKMPRYVKNLKFSDNFLPNISRNTFKNISFLNLQSLSLRFNNISFVANDSFSIFHQLSHLDLNGNNIASDVLYYALKNLIRSGLVFLSLEYMNLDYKDRMMLKNLDFNNLETLLLDGNDISVYNQSDYRAYPSLQVLSLRHNNIHMVSLAFSSTLKILNLMENKIEKLPNFCWDNITYFPNLLKLQLNHNFIEEINRENIRCLHRLYFLSLDSNMIEGIKENTFSELKSLKFLFLENLKSLRSIEKYALSSRSVENISLAYSIVNFKDNVHRDAFIGCSTITSLDLNGNMMESASEHHLNGWFGHLRSLTSFALGRCDLRFFPKFISQNFIHLEHLSIYGNNIQNIPNGAFDRMENLTILSLAGNHIAKIDERVFPNVVRQRLRVIILSHNPFACNCELLWFIEWKKLDPQKFKSDPNEYVCDSPGNMRGRTLSKVDLTKETCYLSSFTSLIMIGCLGIIIIIIVSLSVLYKWRWHIRYYIYLKKQKPYYYRPVEAREVEYDAYVIYSIENIQWIKKELIRNLEEAGIKLYIRDRDSLAGLPIVDNVVNNIQVSRGILIVLSNAMVRDEKCQFELMFVQRQEEGQRIPIILVLLEEVQSANITPSVYALVKMNSYISWGEERDARELFWNRLKQSLSASQEREIE